MSKKRFFTFLLGITCLFTLSMLPPRTEPSSECVIVWDIGYVLARINKKNLIMKDLGLSYMLRCAWHGVSSTKMRHYMYEALEQYYGPQPEATHGKLPVEDENGVKLPLFMADAWLCSKMGNAALLQEASCAVDQWHPTTPVSEGVRALVKQTLLTTLSAQTLGKNTHAIKETTRLVKKYAEQGIPQYILSNFEQEAFEAMYNNSYNKELFSYFDPTHITTSGECHYAKPHHTIYEHFVKIHNLQGKRIIFIDDQKSNVDAACECGWEAIHLCDADYKKLAVELDNAVSAVNNEKILGTV